MTDRAVVMWIEGQPRPQSRPRPSKRGGFKPNPVLKAWRTSVQRAAEHALQGQRAGVPWGKGDNIRATLVFVGAHASADDDNLAKAVIDSCKCMWPDDNQVRFTTYRVPHEKGQARGCLVRLEDEPPVGLYEAEALVGYPDECAS